MAERLSPFNPSIITAPQWRQIVNSATDTAVITIDADGRVTSWSEGARQILGWTEAQMLGQTLQCIFTVEDRERDLLGREIRDARQFGRGGGDEGWRMRSDGSRIWATGEMTPIRDLAGQVSGFIKILRDRTARRAAEESIQEERHALAVLNRVGSALAQETDLKRLVQTVIDAGVALSGAKFGAFFYNVATDAGERLMLYTLAGATPDEFSKFPMPRNTAVFAATFSGSGIVRADDITRDARYGHNLPFQGMPQGHLPVKSYLAIPVSSRSGEVLGGMFFGHPEPAVFDARTEQVLGGLASEAAVAIDNTRLSQSAQREIEERKRIEVVLRDLNVSLEQQVAERTAELRRNEEALRQSQKMEVVGQLTGGVAHDFNNLLQIILGNLETVRRNLPAELARLGRATETAMNGARRAAALTQQLLAFSRRQPLNPKPLDVNALVSGMSELLHRTLGETISVENVGGAGLWLVEADANELEAAILNLAINARDAMPNGGRLTIETANMHIDSSYTSQHSEVLPGQYVAVAVTDTGVGMDSKTMARAFEPFFTTKPVGKGTGLGLSQVYGFVRQSGGHVKIYSEVGQGSTIKIYLPRLLASEVPAPRSDDRPLPDGCAEETVLVIEDDDEVRTYSVETLRELGYRVFEAPDGPSGLSLLERQTQVNLLFTDIVLPGGMTGAQVAAQARRIRPDLKVLFTTGYARNAIVHQGRLDKGVHLITKPFSFADLAAKVRDVLDGVGA